MVRFFSPFTVVLCCSLLVSTVIAQTLKADIDHDRIETQAGNRDVTIVCRIPQPIVSCRFVIPGVKDEIKLGEKFASKDERFEYVGSDQGGRGSGYCGIKIKEVDESFHGNGSCLLDPDNGIDAVAHFEIIISRAPVDPVIHIIEPTGRLEADKPITAECRADDARPPGENFSKTGNNLCNSLFSYPKNFSKIDVVPRREGTRIRKHSGGRNQQSRIEHFFIHNHLKNSIQIEARGRWRKAHLPCRAHRIWWWQIRKHILQSRRLLSTIAER